MEPQSLLPPHNTTQLRVSMSVYLALSLEREHLGGREHSMIFKNILHSKQGLAFNKYLFNEEVTIAE